MQNLIRSTLTILFSSFIITLLSQTIEFNDSWGEQGFKISERNASSITINYSVHEFSMDAVNVKGNEMKAIHLPAGMVPNNEGAPDLAGSGHYIAIPQGATPKLRVVSYRKESYKGIEVAPAPRIPLDTDDGPLFYQKDQQIYTVDAYYPAEPFIISEKTSIRGVDAVMLGVTPFQYNPVSKELLVYRDVVLEIEFSGGNSSFGEDRYRSRWFDPILRDRLLNFDDLPAPDYSARAGTKDDGFEYVIITLDDPDFLAWADTLGRFRKMQGISTGIFTTTEIGGNNTDTIENFINNAYNTWAIPPVAVLLMGDYGSGGSGILSPIWNNYCVSDHIYGDVNGNGMADVIMARMTAQDTVHLKNMIDKIRNYETNPPTYESFYNPITALGWQTERWFQICSESIGGYFKNEKGKFPVRINEVYGGNPENDPWSTATNTSTILDVFGPNGLGYIPADPDDLGNWDGGNATDINNAINAGAFILQHRDHGGTTGWGEPDYRNGDLDGLSNEDPVFVFSINCLTGKYNISGECFTEKFHRMQHGALGLIAASEVSYSFVNDTYVWGLYDYMWPDFLPQFGPTIDDQRGMLPAFANVAAKYFLKASSWPWNVNNKEVTYNLFHHHGGAFQTLYSEVPMSLMVSHDNVLLAGISTFTVTADSGALIALSFDGEIMGTAESDGTPQSISVDALGIGDVFDVVVTKQNYFRYHDQVEVIPSTIPYVVYDDFTINDSEGNNNGLLDYGESVLLSLTLKNVGVVDAFNVEAELGSPEAQINITDSLADYGDVPALQSVTVDDAYAFDVAPDIYDGQILTFNVDATDGDSLWESSFSIQAFAPVLKYAGFSIDDASGNGNGRLDPGETVAIIIDVENNGSSAAHDVEVALSCSGKSFVTVVSGPVMLGDIQGNGEGEAVFTVNADENTPGGFFAFFNVNISADMGISAAGGFDLMVGQFDFLVLDLDPNNYSGPAMMEAIGDLDLIASYTTEFPEELGDHKTIFLNLGIIFEGHQLNEEESEKLVTFLENGGNLYMEGRRTWYDDPPQPIHDMFNINVEVEGNYFEYDTITGIDGTFAGGMQFTYDNPRPFNDYYMMPEGNAFSIFTGPGSAQNCAVAYDEGSYKTIGCAFEFGSLVEAAPPSTRQQLMLEYIEFFDDVATSLPEYAEAEESASIGNIYPNPFNDHTVISVDLKEDMHVAVDIYSMDGRKVASLLDKHMPAGRHQVHWDGNGRGGQSLKPGVYICTLKTNSVIATKKMVRY